MSLPSPSQLLGAGQFVDWYPQQYELLEQSLDWFYSPARFLGMSIPTGSGKSLSSLLLSKLSEARTVVLTATKGLQEQYCVSPETKVLTAELRWVRADSLSGGDKLLAFDENINPVPGVRRRMWRESVVEVAGRVDRPCYRLTFDDGTIIICSAEHKWLAYDGAHHCWMWRETAKLRCDEYCKNSVVTKLVDVWDDKLTDRDLGYLAGVFDGEGFICTQNGANGAGNNIRLVFSQRYNEMLDKVHCLLDKYGFRYYTYHISPRSSRRSETQTISIQYRPDALRFLGLVRPARLLARLDLSRLGAIFNYKKVSLVRKEFVGVQRVVSLRTSTRTYIAEGFASHNCNDARAIGAVNVVGQNNFPCILVNGRLTADEGPCHDGIPCAVREQCPYRVQLKKALEAKLVITNYAYWLAQTNFSSGLGDFGLMICDEGHSCFGAMENYLTVFISRLDIRSIGIDFPESADQWNVWKSWADVSAPIAADAVNKIEQEIKGFRSQNQPVPSHVSRYYRTANSVHARLKRLSSVGEQWVIQKTYHGYRFVPKWVANYSQHLFHDIPKVVLMSAILSHRSADYLGVPSNGSRAWIDMDSHFPPENTPIWHIPTARINYRTDDFGSTIWCSRIDQIIQRRLDRKGIVFTVSYERAKMLLSRSRFKDIMFTHSTGDVVQVVEKFKKAPAPAVLVSPSVTTGYDFPMDISGHGVPQYIVIGKIPYPDTKDLVTQARHEDDKDWTSYMAMETLVQSCGRMTRSENDKCEVLCIDDNARWFLFKFSRFAPAWFNARVKGSLETVPNPPF